MSQLNAPTEVQLETLKSLPSDAPLGVLNLFKFNAQAVYQSADPEYNTPDANITGREAYQRYSAAAGPIILARGGRLQFSTTVDQVLIGPEAPKWELAAILYFPTRQAFVELMSDPEFQAVSRHRKAALAQHTMLHLNGAPFRR